MILIADSGSTKTDWRLVISDKETSSFETIGFNPYHVNENKILSELINSKLDSIKLEVTQLYFYGAGCSSVFKREEIAAALSKFFKGAIIEVNHDLLAAARALCFNEAGMVGILGTGSNTCMFDGKNIVKNVAALGYILGDEGSGACIGKTFIQAFLNNELPQEIELQFKQQYHIELTDILDAVYKKPLPNRFLAQFTKFVFEQKHLPEMAQIIDSSFNSFFEKHICKYENFQQYPLNIVGSVGYIFKEELEKVATRYHVKLGKVIKQPIEELVLFHAVN